MQCAHLADVTLACSAKISTFGHKVMYSLRAKQEAKTHSIMTSHVSIGLPNCHLLKTSFVGLRIECYTYWHTSQ